MGVSHLWAALRYVERNPVRAGLVEDPRSYEWSSAEAHGLGNDRWRIADMQFWRESGGAVAWQRLLGESEEDLQIKALRRATYSGQPFGNEAFAEEMRTQRKALMEKVAGEVPLCGGPLVARARPWSRAKRTGAWRPQKEDSGSGCAVI